MKRDSATSTCLLICSCKKTGRHLSHLYLLCVTQWTTIIMLSWNLPVCPCSDLQYVTSTLTLWSLTDFVRYLAFHSGRHACQVSTGERHSFLINCTMLLLTRVCQTTSIAWLTHQFKVAQFVGRPATVANPPPPPPPPPVLPAAGIEAFSHAREVFSSQRLQGSITLRWP